MPHAIAPDRIRSEADLDRALAALRRHAPDLAPVMDRAGRPPLRAQTGGFEGLARVVAYQQISTAAGDAIWRRCQTVFRPFTPATIAAAGEPEFRAAGLSSPKIRTLRALAEAALAGAIDLDDAEGWSGEMFRARLLAVKGIGPWTADIFALFAHGHLDVWPAGDLALQVAAAHALGLDARPTPKAMEALAEPWRPYRGVAARVLFAYYRTLDKGRDGAPL